MTQEQFLEKVSWKNRLSGERGYSKRKKNESRNAVAKKKKEKRSRVNGTRNRRKQRLPGIMQGKRCQKYIPLSR